MHAYQGNINLNSGGVLIEQKRYDANIEKIY